jgi:hypothetical protein
MRNPLHIALGESSEGCLRAACRTLLDAQAVIAAPPELYLASDVIVEGTGEPPQ